MPEKHFRNAWLRPTTVRKRMPDDEDSRGDQNTFKGVESQLGSLSLGVSAWESQLGSLSV